MDRFDFNVIFNNFLIPFMENYQGREYNEIIIENYIQFN